MHQCYKLFYLRTTLFRGRAEFVNNRVDFGSKRDMIGAYGISSLELLITFCGTNYLGTASITISLIKVCTLVNHALTKT